MLKQTEQTQSVNLPEENQRYRHTGGVSQENTQHRFIPAFLDSESGEVSISRFSNGHPAPFHLLDGLPESWIAEKDSSGRVVSVKQSVVSGFVRLGRFFTRQQAAEYIEQCC